VVHAFGTSVEGWLVLVVRRHVNTLAELTDEEAADLGPLVRDVSKALQATTGCAKTYIAQFAEHPQHPHVHVHLIPRSSDLADAQRGPGIFSRLGVPDADCVTEERMNVIAGELQQHLAAR